MLDLGFRSDKNENPSLYDVCCICHLADLYQGWNESSSNRSAFIYYFHHSSNLNQKCVDVWHSFDESELKVVLKHCPTHWLSFPHCIGKYLEQLEVSFFASSPVSMHKAVLFGNPNKIIPFADTILKELGIIMRVGLNPAHYPQLAKRFPQFGVSPSTILNQNLMIYYVSRSSRVQSSTTVMEPKMIVMGLFGMKSV